MYAAKCEESLTQNRLYCPAPTCSTFIPPRSYAPVDERNTVAEIDGIRLQSRSSLWIVTASSLRRNARPAPWSFAPVAVASRTSRQERTTSCLAARALIFTTDPKLERNLTKWGVKRWYVSSLPTIVIGFLAYMSLVINSPKCRCCVRLMSGCSHVRCQCQFEFCLSVWPSGTVRRLATQNPLSLAPSAPFCSSSRNGSSVHSWDLSHNSFFFFNTPFSTYCYQDGGY